MPPVPDDFDPAKTALTIALRGDDQAWSAAEVAAVRTTLDSELSRLSGELRSATAELDYLLADSGGAGDDQADTGSRALDREQSLTLVNNLRDIIRHTELALERLIAGEFGVCENCRRPIGKARLQAFPRAVLCVECKQRQERR